MAVSKKIPDEIFNERAQYLGNIDELLFETLTPHFFREYIHSE
jgi:hypothetical protein